MRRLERGDDQNDADRRRGARDIDARVTSTRCRVSVPMGSAEIFASSSVPRFEPDVHCLIARDTGGLEGHVGGASSAQRSASRSNLPVAAAGDGRPGNVHALVLRGAGTQELCNQLGVRSMSG